MKIEIIMRVSENSELKRTVLRTIVETNINGSRNGSATALEGKGVRESH